MYLLFQSTPPVWVVTQLLSKMASNTKFQSTPPVWVVTSEVITINLTTIISIHTTRVGGDIDSKSLSDGLN